MFRRLLLALLAARQVRPATETCRIDLECYPGVPYHRNLLWKVALYAGLRLLPYRSGEFASTTRPKLRLFWPDIDPAVLVRSAPVQQPSAEWWSDALNGSSRDTSKRTVERVFEEVFGYCLAVDPTTHEGRCVAKSNHGSTHDGRVLECPITEADPALAYELLIDNRADAGRVVDFRVPVVGDEMPFVYLKYRPLRTRFSNTNSTIAIARPEDVFSKDEREGLRAFRRGMGLDLGEMDVLRDRDSGRIYVVDVNRPVWGPPRPIRTGDAVQAVRAYTAAFARLAERTAG